MTKPIDPSMAILPLDTVASTSRRAGPTRRELLRGLGLTSVAVVGSALLTACGGSDEASPAAASPNTPAVPDTPAKPTVPQEVTSPTLTGRAILPADSFVAGPTSGQFISGGDYDRAVNTYGYTLPFSGKQPMQGFSAMIPGPVPGVFYALQDNGFGGKAASPDALLHIYAITFDWANGRVVPAHFTTGAPLSAFTSDSYIRLSDPNRLLGYQIVADMTAYPGTSVSPAGQTIPVDPAIIAGHLLTGYDIDPESLQMDAQGNFWIGDEFGPFLLKFDKAGRLLAREVQMPNLAGIGANALVQTPNNPYIAGNTSVANLGGSGGLESLAIDASRRRLYGMYEKELSGDDVRARIISVYNLSTLNFETHYRYRVGVGQRINGSGNLETEVFSVNDMTAINDREFLVVEKDSGAGDARTGLFAAANASRNAAQVKRVYRINLDQIDANGYLVKEEVVDLMKLLDPKKVGGADTIAGVFAFPMECVETIAIIDSQTLLLVNDNNYPGGSPSRLTNRVDSNEFIRVRLPKALPIAAS